MVHLKLTSYIKLVTVCSNNSPGIVILVTIASRVTLFVQDTSVPLSPSFTTKVTELITMGSSTDDNNSSVNAPATSEGLTADITSETPSDEKLHKWLVATMSQMKVTVSPRQNSDLFRRTPLTLAISSGTSPANTYKHTVQVTTDHTPYPQTPSLNTHSSIPSIWGIYKS